VGHPHFTNAALHDLSDNPNVSHARASRELGYEPRPFRETVLDTIRWFAEHGFIRATTAQRQMV
jgi:dihydroflavonol-4-reductase